MLPKLFLVIELVHNVHIYIMYHTPPIEALKCKNTQCLNYSHAYTCSRCRYVW